MKMMSCTIACPPNGLPVAAHVATMLGDTCLYFLGATSDAGKKSKASYLLQWRVIQEAARMGISWYDLGGFNPNTMPGVAKFKAGLGGVEHRFPGQYCLHPLGGRSRAYSLLERGFRGVCRCLRREHVESRRHAECKPCG